MTTQRQQIAKGFQIEIFIAVHQSTVALVEVPNSGEPRSPLATLFPCLAVVWWSPGGPQHIQNRLV